MKTKPQSILGDLIIAQGFFVTGVLSTAELVALFFSGDRRGHKGNTEKIKGVF